MIDPDTDLLSGLRAGEADALHALMNRHLTRIHRLCVRLIGDPHQAEDVAQEVFVATWVHAPKWREGEAKLLTWMCRVATNRCLDYLKRRKPIYTDVLPDVADTQSPAEQRLAIADRDIKLRAGLDRLPDRQKAALVLFYFDELSQKEAAEVMELGLKAYESLLTRAKNALRATVELEEIGHDR